MIATEESTRASLDSDGVGERVGLRHPVLLRKRDPHPAELAQLADDLVRKRSLVRSGSAATGAVARSAKSRTVSRSASCSSGRSKTTARAYRYEYSRGNLPVPPNPSPGPLRGQALRALFKLHENFSAPHGLAL